MQIYEKRNRKKRTTLCSYCGGEGHLWITCPYPQVHKEQIEADNELNITLFEYPLSLRYSQRDEKTGRLLSEVFLKKRAIEFSEKQLARTAPTTKRRKSRRRCGFCNSPSHNRKNCKVMKSLIDDLALANQNYRMLFFDKFIEEQGIAEGTLVNISGKQLACIRGTPATEGVGIISEIDWNSINLTLSSDQWEFKSTLNVTVLLDGQTIVLSNPLCSHENRDRPLISKAYCCSSKGCITSVLSPSRTKPSAEWFNEGYDNCWEWVTKNKTLADVGEHFAELLEEYHPKQDSKFQRRLARYKKK